MATVEQLRILVQDPEGATQKLSNTDYELFISMEGNVYRAAAVAARAIAAKFATGVDLKAGPVSLNNSQKFSQYMEMARNFDQRAREGGGGSGGGPILTGVSVSDMESVSNESDRVEPLFYIGMNNDTTDTLYGD